MTNIERNFSGLATDTTASGVSWAAILGGAAAAAALSLILLILGAGLGFSAISPWSHTGVSATAIGISSIIWLAFTQLAASGIGGYLAGRLRIKWATVHTDEVYFRDTAHGFLAWAVATLATVALVGSVIGNVVSTGVTAGAAVATSAIGAAGATGIAAASQTGNGNRGNSANDGVMAYMTDSLFRADPAASDSGGNGDGALRLETGRIFAHAIRAKTLSQEDRQYVAQLVAKRTGLTPADAEKRVTDLFNKTQTAINEAEQSAKQAADTARKAASYSALWMFLALLLGAFVASVAATFGGRQRDRVIHLGSATA
ncbi:MAG: hypothetical protein V4805_04205 [Pseudomonadota bacterium]